MDDRTTPDAPEFSSPLARILQTPSLLNWLLSNRLRLLILFGIAAILVMANYFEIAIWPCPILSHLNVPCPGCGLTRSVTSILHGEINLSFSLHPFGFSVIITAAFLLIATLLPTSHRHRMRDWLVKMERRAGILAFSLILFLVWGAVRLMIHCG